MSRMPRGVPAGKSLLIRKLNLIPVEVVVQGWLTGPGWLEYQKSGQINNGILPPHLQEMDKLPKPLVSAYDTLTPGSYQRIDFEEVWQELGYRSVARKALSKSIEVYEVAAKYAAKKGILLVCASFEFGYDRSGEITFAGSTLSPDSSLYMREEDHEVGQPPISMTHQPIVEHIRSQPWNKREPAPSVPVEVINRTAEGYRELSRRLTGISPVG